MKVAFISYDFGEYCVQHTNGLLPYGEVLLVMPSKLFAPYANLVESDVVVRTFSKPRLRQPFRQVQTARWIVKQIEEFEPDVIHFQLGHMWFNFVLPLLRRKFPIVFTVHDPRQHLGDRGAKNTPQWIMDFGYRRADQIIVHGSQLSDVLVNQLGISRKSIHVIPHIAIGTGDLSERESGENLILFFGRIWPYKGLEFLIRAQPLINQAVPDAKIVICGQGEDFERYHDMMKAPDRFVVHNRWIKDDERAVFFQRSSVVVLPYIEATQSGVVPIAYAHKKPVVATRTGGLPDVVEDGKTGFLVEPENEVELANAVIKLLQDKQLQEEMGEAGNQKLETELAPDVVCKQTAKVYQLAIKNRAEKKSPSKAELSNSV